MVISWLTTPLGEGFFVIPVGDRHWVIKDADDKKVILVDSLHPGGIHGDHRTAGPGDIEGSNPQYWMTYEELVTLLEPIKKLLIVQVKDEIVLKRRQYETDSVRNR